MERNLFLFKGIDKQKSTDDAVKKSVEGSVIVHFHSKPRKCADYMHEMYENGQLVDEWGTADGSAEAPRGD